MKPLHIYFLEPPPKDRFLPGDRYLLPLIRRLLRGKKISGVKKVYINLCHGLSLLGVKYDRNLPFEQVKEGEPVIVLGNGRAALDNYRQPNPVIAGIGLMTHPSEWPMLMKEYPVARYLQHSAWTRDIYIPYYGEAACALWAVGIDTVKWAPAEIRRKTTDVLIYNKVMWDKTRTDDELRTPIIDYLKANALSYREITYGNYRERDYRSLLQECRSVIFLCEHESQGFACCEAMSMDVPVMAWDQGLWLDPHRFSWNDPFVSATSVPFFDERCGERFNDIHAFRERFGLFWQNVGAGKYSARQFILENLTLEISAKNMLNIVAAVYK